MTQHSSPVPIPCSISFPINPNFRFLNPRIKIKNADEAGSVLIFFNNTLFISILGFKNLRLGLVGQRRGQREWDRRTALQGIVTLPIVGFELYLGGYIRSIKLSIFANI